MSYLEPLPAMAAWDHYLDSEHIEDLQRMFFGNMGFGALLLGFHPATYSFRRKKGIDLLHILPLRDSFASYNGEYAKSLPDSVLDATGYRELLQAMNDHGQPLLKRFQQYRDIAFARKAAAES